MSASMEGKIYGAQPNRLETFPGSCELATQGSIDPKVTEHVSKHYGTRIFISHGHPEFRPVSDSLKHQLMYLYDHVTACKSKLESCKVTVLRNSPEDQGLLFALSTAIAHDAEALKQLRKAIKHALK